jgi:hypothetical protein
VYAFILLGSTSGCCIRTFNAFSASCRYLVGEDALKMMEKRKSTTEEEFTRLVMNSVLGRDSS